MIHTDVSTHLIIDRLSICSTFSHADDVEYAVKLLMQDNITKEYPGLMMKPGLRYRIQAKIRLPFDTKEADTVDATFQLGPKSPGMGIPSCRLDFNPAKLTEAGWQDLDLFISNSTAMSLEKFFNTGKITRIDLAVDLVGLSLDDVIIQTSKKRKVGLYSDQLGSPQTAYLGAGKNRLVAYNKPDKTSNTPSLRIECRKNPQCAGHELHALPNPFKVVALYSASVLDGMQFGVPPIFFADSVRLRGLNRALKLLKNPSRALVEARLHGSEALLPDADDIWEQYPERLKEVGLLVPAMQPTAKL